MFIGAPNFLGKIRAFKINKLIGNIINIEGKTQGHTAIYTGVLHYPEIAVKMAVFR